jgi:hypothetical protein
MNDTRIAESRDVRFRPVEVRADTGCAELVLRGLLFHSATVAESIQLIDEGDATRVLVEMALAHAGKSGSFTVAVPLPARVERVTFGLDGEEIWSREYRFQ